MNIFVGNLSYSTTDEAVRALFAAHGQVESARIIKDRESGASRGFAFVEMPNDEEARNAMKALNGAELEGRSVRVSEAHGAKERRGGRGTREKSW